MNTPYKGLILIGVLIGIGVALIIPAYFQSRTAPVTSLPNKVMLAFTIKQAADLLNKWCSDLSSAFQKYEINATIFIPGKVAEIYPECVSLFGSNNNIDIGSQTYSYVNLTAIEDYSLALEQVKEGKRIVDSIGKLDSKLFKAPYGSTDQNIYSLLSRSGITADFSYNDHYNLYENGQFIRYDLTTYNGSANLNNTLNTISSSDDKGKVILINFDNSVPVNQIDWFISGLLRAVKNIQFVNGSDLADLHLNISR